MSLSISKLQEFITEKGFICNKYFVMNDRCFFIELFCITTVNTFLLYIPSKFNFSINFEEDVYKIKSVDTPNNYISEENENLSSYENDLLLSSKHIEEDLENNYKHEIELKEHSDKDLNSIYRQLKRLKHSVKNLKYKICIIYKNYLCTIRRDNSIDFFSIKHYSKKSTKKILLIADLETLYDNFENLSSDLLSVLDSIYDILQKNQNAQSSIFMKLLEQKKDIISYTIKNHEKINNYSNLLLDLKNMFVKILEKENTLSQEYYKIEDITSMRDIDKSLKRNYLQKQIEELTNTKNDIVKNLSDIKEKKENTIINIDNIMFDNTVMLDRVIKNFDIIKDF